MSESLGMRLRGDAGDTLGTVIDYETRPLLEHDPLESARRSAERQRRATRVRSKAYRAHLVEQTGSRRPQLPESAAGVLDRAGAARMAVHAAQVDELRAVAAWAALHATPAEQASREAAAEEWCEQDVRIAGEGAPGVEEFCIAELGLRLDTSTETARLLLADAVELTHRLPLTWARVQAGGVPVYRARRVAAATRELSPEAAAHVDETVAPIIATMGTAALKEAICEALWRHDLEAAIARMRTAREERGVRIDLDTHAQRDAGIAAVHGQLDRADAVELERALAHLAHELLLAGSTESLDVRRSQALGMLARGETDLSLPAPMTHDPALEEWDEPPAPAPAVRRRQVVLHVHLTHAALQGADPVATLEGIGPVLAEEVRAWCTAPGSTTQVIVKPVIDLNASIATDANAIPTRLAEQVRLRDRTCVFPHCQRDSRRCDLDHITPYDPDGPPGQTSSDNLAPLCRRHHRLKTHAPGWSYARLSSGAYAWTGPR